MTAYPGWVGPDGAPLSWRHYVVGNRALGRFRAQRTVLAYDAASAAQAVPEDKRTWLSRQQTLAGWD